jgi:hypothetical protein
MQTIYILFIIADLILNVVLIRMIIDMRKKEDVAIKHLIEVETHLNTIGTHLLQFKGYVEAVLENKP